MIVDKKLSKEEDLDDFGENVAKICKSSDIYLLKKQHLIGENHNGKR